mgnify:CR=1 FL=1
MLGRLPDLSLHCQRLIKSAEIMGMTPNVSAKEIEAVAREGASRLPKNIELYICTMLYPSV